MAFFKRTPENLIVLPEAGTPDGVTRTFARLHNQLNNNETVFQGYPEELNEYLGLAANTSVEISNPRPRLTLNPGNPNNTVLVSCGGGKDGFAAAILLEKQGLRPTMFHCHGLNRAYPKEIEAVREASTILGYPAVFRNVQYSSKMRFFSSPVRDQLILAMMLDHASTSRTVNFSMGVEFDNPIAECNHSVNWSDSFEMVAAANKWFSTVYPGYKWHCPIVNHSQSFRVLFNHDRALFSAIQSCVMPVRFQGMRKKATEKQYGLKLLPNRCGVCQKCAVEYLHLVCLGHVEPNQPYIERCIEIYRAKSFEVYGVNTFFTWGREALIRKCVDDRYLDLGVLLKRPRTRLT